MPREIWLRTNGDDATDRALEIMGLRHEDKLVSGAACVTMPPGAAYDRWPDNKGEDAVMNVEYWSNVLVPHNWTDRQVEDAKAAFREKGGAATKPSLNGRGDSNWWDRTDGADQMSMFETNADGGDAPQRVRHRYSV